MSADEQALVSEVTGVINSESVHKVEFVSIDGSLSKEGTSAFKTHLNNTQAGVGDAMVPSANKVSGVENNTRAIRVDNLIRRVMRIPTYRDEHGGAKIVNPYALP